MPMAGKHSIYDRNAQRGAALIVSLVMLVVITMIGVIAMSGSHLEWLMTNNSQFQSGAYRNATVALWGGLPTIPAAAPNPPPPTSTLSPSDLTDATKWSDGTLAPIPITTAACTVTCEYIVEYLGCNVFTYSPPSLLVPTTDVCNSNPSDVSIHTYRVWAYGSDGKGAARILQATVRRSYNPAATAPASMIPPLANNWVEIP